MKNILLVIFGDIHYGGVSVILQNLLEHMDRNDLSFTVYAFGDVTVPEVYEKYRDLGARVILGKHKSFSAKEISADLFRIMSEKKYDVVHCNTGGLTLTLLTMFISFIKGVPLRIAHSHAQNNNGAGKISARRSFKEKLYTSLIVLFSNKKMSCSAKAACHLFGDKAGAKALILKNGIDSSKFSFNPETRKKTRSELHITDEDLFCHVGSFLKVKNHGFLIDIFKSIKDITPNSKLLLIGEGPLKDSIRKKAEDLNISNDIIFLGTTNEVYRYLQAADAFIMPSFSEGMPLVSVEAQAADLPTYLSDGVPAEAVITEKAKHIPLERTADFWAEFICSDLQSHPYTERKDRSHDISKSGYHISTSAEILRSIYTE